MNFEMLANSKLVSDLGWTLLHSVWQISLVAVGLYLALFVLRHASARWRYVVCVASLAIAVAMPAVTLIQLSNRTDAHPADVTAKIGEPRSGLAESLSLGETGGQSVAVDSRRSDATTVAGLSDFLERNIQRLSPVAVLLWLLGVLIFSIRLGGGFSQLGRFRNSGSVEVESEWQTKFTGLCDRVGVSSTVRLLKSAVVPTPIAIGIFKPVIIVPASLFLQIDPRQLETIIAHELIHIRRYDPLVNLFQCAIESLLFYHPGIWWISTQIRREREFAADAAVTEIFEGSHVTYARALANLEEIRLATNQQMPRYATAANGGNFMQRIQRILKVKTEASRASSAWTAGMAVVLTSAFFLALFSFSSSELVNAQQRSGSRKLAIGFVGIPPLDRTANPPKDSDATARLLIQELKEHKVPAIGFLTGSMVSDGEKLYPVRANIAKMWVSAGFELGVGGFKHVWLSKTPTDEYIANIEKNEKVARQILGENGQQPKYFSYPFLNTGKSVEDKAKVEAWLGSRGYSSVKYTIDNNEWMYSYAYDMARNDNDIHTMAEIREAYLAYMGRMFDHFEAYSQDLFGRDIPQTMVLTPSRLITDTADDFFAVVSKRGYTFVSIEDAQSDPAYKTKEDFVGDAGISWFERWTMAKGNRLRQEPEVDRLVQKIWDERQTSAKK